MSPVRSAQSGASIHGAADVGARENSRKQAYPVTADRRSKGVVDYHARRCWSSAASPFVGSTSTETDIAISSLLLDLHPYTRSSHGRPTTLSCSWLGRIDFALLPGHARGSDCADEDESKGDSPERSQPGPATSTHKAKLTPERC